MDHQCLPWAKQPYIFTLQILNFPILSLYVTSYQKLIIYLAQISRRGTLYHSWDMDKELFIQREGYFLTYMRNCEQQHNITVVPK